MARLPLVALITQVRASLTTGALGWHLATTDSMSCTTVCSNVGLECRNEDMRAHNNEVDSSEELEDVLSDFGLTCSSFSSSVGTSGGAPSISPSSTCYVLNALPQVSCGRVPAEGAPSRGNRRLCWCSLPATGGTSTALTTSMSSTSLTGISTTVSIAATRAISAALSTSMSSTGRMGTSTTPLRIAATLTISPLTSTSTRATWREGTSTIATRTSSAVVPTSSTRRIGTSPTPEEGTPSSAVLTLSSMSTSSTWRVGTSPRPWITAATRASSAVMPTSTSSTRRIGTSTTPKEGAASSSTVRAAVSASTISTWRVGASPRPRMITAVTRTSSAVLPKSTSSTRRIGTSKPPEEGSSTSSTTTLAQTHPWSDAETLPWISRDVRTTQPGFDADSDPAAVLATVATLELELLEGFDQLEVAGVVTKQVDGVLLAATKICATQTDGANLSIPDTWARVELPREICRSTQNSSTVILIVAVIDPSKLQNLGAESIKVKNAININVFDQSSKAAFEVEALSEPVLIHIPIDQARRDLECSYYDDSLGAWTSRGLALREMSNATLVCATSHLSLFGAIVGLPGKTLQCSNAHLLNADGISHLSQGPWWHEPAALVVFALIGLHILMFPALRRFDHRKAKEDLWTDDDFFSIEKKPSKGWLMWLLKLFVDDEEIELMKEFIREIAASKRTRCSFLGWVLVLVAVKADAYVKSMLKASVMGFEPRAMNAIVRRVGRDASQQSLRALSITQGFHSDDGHLAKDQRLFTYSYRNFIPLFTPWAEVFRFSIFASSSARGMMLMSRVFGALFASALFFSVSGSATSSSSPVECQAKNFGEKLGMVVAVGIASSIPAAIPAMVFRRLRRRRFVSICLADSNKKRRQLKAWRVKGKLFWVFCVSYTGCLIFFVFLFLANVSGPDADAWLISAVVFITKEAMLQPLIMAGISAAWVTRVSPLIARTESSLDEILARNSSCAALPEAVVHMDVAMRGLNYSALEEQSTLTVAFQNKVSNVLKATMSDCIKAYEISVEFSHHGIAASLRMDADQVEMAIGCLADESDELAKCLAAGLAAIPGADAAIYDGEDLAVRTIAYFAEARAQVLVDP